MEWAQHENVQMRGGAQMVSSRRLPKTVRSSRRNGRAICPARKSVSDNSRDSRATRSASQSSPVVSSTTESGETPASSTPDSSNVSRTAAHTSDRAIGSVVVKPAAQSLARGPAQPMSAVASAASTDPPLTTVHQPVRGKGEAAVRLLLSVMEGGHSAPVHRRLETRLIIRGSTGPAPR